MKIAYVHVLPLEYYPPARNTLVHFSRQPRWEVRAWTSNNGRGLPVWNHERVAIQRASHGDPSSNIFARISEYFRWHLRVARDLRAWKPDVIMAVEPHSSLAVWLYYNLFRGSAPLFIHHHEYYAPADYQRPGMRLLRLTNRLDGDSLLERAVWASQTNASRLRLMLADHPRIRPQAGHILPNYPPEEWVTRAGTEPDRDVSGRTRLLYVGSASLEDTFIAEIAKWVKERPGEYSLHVVGENITREVWLLLDSLDAPNITTECRGRAYADLPELFASFDVGLVLYKGNTLNFVHNVPNKAIEYLASGLEVWYPPEMEAMRCFHESQPAQRMRMVDFQSLPSHPFHRVQRRCPESFAFTCENALMPLVAELQKVTGHGP